MAKRKPKKPTQYQKEIQRIKRQMKRLEKRGYILNIQLPKTLKGARNLTLEKLYKKAAYIDTETGELLTGKQGRRLERQKATEKARQTRIKNNYRRGKQYSNKPANLGQIVVDNFLQYVDAVMADTAAAPTWRYANAEHSAIAEIKDHITNIRNTNREIFRSKLQNEIASSNINEVGRRLAMAWQTEQLDSVIDSMLHGYSDEESNRATILLVEIIMGHSLSFSDLQYASSINDQTDYWNDSV